MPNTRRATPYSLHPAKRFTLSLFNNEVFSADDFRPVENQGIYLTKPALKIYFEHYESRVREPFKLPNTDEEVDFRGVFKQQVHKLSSTILKKEPYQPFRIYE